MEERRRAWWASGFALVLAATTGAAAVHLWWLPCRGTMLVGTPLASFGDAADVADGCVDRMGEGTPFPLPTAAASSSPGLLALIVVTIVAVAVAWLLPVLTEPLSGTSRLVAALPGFAALGVAVLAVGIAYDVPGAEEVAYPLATFLNLLVVSGFAVLLGQVGTWPRQLVTALDPLRRWLPEGCRRRSPREQRAVGSTLGLVGLRWADAALRGGSLVDDGSVVESLSLQHAGRHDPGTDRLGRLQ